MASLYNQLPAGQSNVLLVSLATLRYILVSDKVATYLLFGISHRISVITNFITIIIFFAVKTPSNSLFRIMMIIPDTTILNIMACRVYRNVKFGRHTEISFIQSSMVTHKTDPIHFTPDDFDGNAAGRETPGSKRYIPSSLGSHSQDIDVEKKRSPTPRGIEVTKVIEFTRD